MEFGAPYRSAGHASAAAGSPRWPSLPVPQSVHHCSTCRTAGGRASGCGRPLTYRTRLCSPPAAGSVLFCSVLSAYCSRAPERACHTPARCGWGGSEPPQGGNGGNRPVVTPGQVTVVQGGAGGLPGQAGMVSAGELQDSCSCRAARSALVS